MSTKLIPMLEDMRQAPREEVFGHIYRVFQHIGQLNADDCIAAVQTIRTIRAELGGDTTRDTVFIRLINAVRTQMMKLLNKLGRGRAQIDLENVFDNALGQPVVLEYPTNHRKLMDRQLR